jgi:hypothetical protein
VERVERDGGGVGTLVHAVCASVPFRMRRPPPPMTEHQP